MRICRGDRKMTARIPVHSDRRLIPDIAPRVALPRNQYIDAESIHAVLQAGPPELGSLAAAAICSFAAFHSAIARPLNVSTINAKRNTFSDKRSLGVLTSPDAPSHIASLHCLLLTNSRNALISAEGHSVSQPAAGRAAASYRYHRERRDVLRSGHSSACANGSTGP